MQVGRVDRASRIIGKSQSYKGLPVRDETMLTETGPIPCMTSAWLLDPPDLIAIFKGASITISILGSMHPPIKVGVGFPPDQEDFSLKTIAYLQRCGFCLEEAVNLAKNLDVHGLKVVPMVDS
jgi:hypothetical protein